jgi:hypothetical protein
LVRCRTEQDLVEVTSPGRWITTVALAFTVVLGLPGTAHASFGEPVTLATEGSLPRVAVDSTGRAVVAWQVFDSPGRVQARTIAADGALGTVSTLAVGGSEAYAPQVAIDSNGRATVVWAHSDGTAYRIQARTIAANGTLGTTRNLSAGDQNADEPQVGFDAGNQATVVWKKRVGLAENWQIQARTIAADGTLGPTKTLSASGEDASRPQVDVSSSGQATVVWYRFDGTNSRIQARTIAADGTLGKTKTLSASGQDATGPQVGTDSNGEGTVVWERFDGTNSRVQVRTIAPSGALGTTRTVSASGQDADQPQVDVSSSGQATVVWQRFDGTADRIQARTIAADGTLSTTKTLSPSGRDADFPQVAMASNGQSTVAWRRFDGTADRAQARTIAADAALGTVDTISARGAFLLHVGLDSSGLATVVWDRSGEIEYARSTP